LVKAGFEVKRQILLPIEWEELLIERAYKLDLLVENKLVLKLKTKFPLPTVSFDQIGGCFSLLGLKYGILLNFKVSLMMDGIHRVFNNGGCEDL
jgi:GxxExxY protein